MNDLLRELRAREPALARDLEREVAALAERRAFGLNFERHVPEAVELPGRNVRKGDKVRILGPRGSAPTKSRDALWRVAAVDRSAGSAIVQAVVPESASGFTIDEKLDTRSVALPDLVVVAEFRDAIYPGLVSTGRLERSADRPFHCIINAENFHALETLLFTHRGRVDCVYIDPPYNTGAKDWKYNNDYVETDDLYRHSKWLAFMERRLLIAKELLNPESSALIVTIDEKEYLRLGLLLEQTFPDAQIEMLTSIISGKGVARSGQFSRVEEYIFTLRFGDQEVALSEHNMLDDTRSAAATVGKAVEWLGLRRREPTARRGARPKQFYPVFIDAKTGHALSIGDAITNDIVRATVPVPDGVVAIWPLLPDGTEGLWGLTPDTARAYLSQGYLRARNFKPSTGYAAVQYLPSGTVASIKCGDISVTGRDADGAVVAEYKVGKGVIPKRVWNVPSHNAETGGTAVLSKLLPGRRFPFPKSLYAVEDVLRFFVSDKPSAVILDFFGGSGTTAHAVMRLNKQDGGRRQCVLITNNEVASDEQAALRKKKFRPGDKEWEELGICEYITKPRIEAAITGISSDGSPVDGDYKFSDKYPMTLGFDENVEFFTLTYESPLRVASHREFAKIAALLWLRAGASGRRIDRLEDGWDVADTYGILANLDRSNAFIKAIKQRASVLIAYIVTDEDRLFESVSRKLGDVVQPVRLYESYLRNFEIESGRGFL